MESVFSFFRFRTFSQTLAAKKQEKKEITNWQKIESSTNDEDFYDKLTDRIVIFVNSDVSSDSDSNQLMFISEERRA